MKRRTFLSAGCALGMAPVMGMPVLTEDRLQQKGSYYEWISYQLHVGNKQNLVADYYRDAAVPALNRTGINHVGVFNVKYGPNMPTLHVIVPHPSLDSIISTNDKLLDDQTFRQAGKRFLEAPLSDMAFVRMEKTILKAFADLPEIQVPEQKKKNTARVFQVRTYESPNLVAAKKKIQMFNEGGEINIFRKTGLQPVLFGETVAGTKMPSLTYVLAFDNMDELAKNWGVFGSSPEWRTLNRDPQYADTVSCINDWIWTPTSFSQL